MSPSAYRHGDRVDGLSACVSPQALAVARTLLAGGHDAVIVGGPVRDLVRGRAPDDIDLATSATPDEMRRLFRRTFVVGKGEVHGTLGIWSPDGVSAHEVTTYRRDVATDGRHAEVAYTTDLAQDLERRDFTINAMAIRPHRTEDHGELIDPQDGTADLAAARLRTVGDPHARFREDYLRVLRAYRFAARLDFTIDTDTRAGLRAAVPGLGRVSQDRIRKELLKLLETTTAPGAVVRVLSEMHADGVLGAILPELAACEGVTQNKYHGFDVLRHILHATDAHGPGRALRRFVLLMHDIGKPATKSVDERGEAHFYGHETVGADMVDAICQRLVFSTADRAWVVEAVAQHMRFHALPETVSPAALRRVARDLTAGVTLEDLLAIRIADKAGAGIVERAIEQSRIDYLQGCIDRFNAEGAALRVTALAMNGSEVMAHLGLTPGPAIGAALNWLLERVVEDPTQNTPEGLRALLDAHGRDLVSAPVTPRRA